MRDLIITEVERVMADDGKGEALKWAQHLLLNSIEFHTTSSNVLLGPREEDAETQGGAGGSVRTRRKNGAPV